jgi:hypothetical protein
VRNRWAELSADEHQKITQLAYQHMKDGACFSSQQLLNQILPPWISMQQRLQDLQAAAVAA